MPLCATNTTFRIPVVYTLKFDHRKLHQHEHTRTLVKSFTKRGLSVRGQAKNKYPNEGRCTVKQFLKGMMKR